MADIIVNQDVVDAIRKGHTANEALSDMYRDEIRDRRGSEDPIFRDMTPMDMAMYDAHYYKDSRVGEIIDNATITTQDPDGMLLPTYIDSRLHEQTAKNDLLGYIVTSRVNTSSMFTESYYFDVEDGDNKANARKVRVAEGADIPLAKMGIGKKGLQLLKYARAVEQTYEAMRLVPIEMFNRTLDWIANDIAGFEAEDACKIALEGDGNDNAALELGTTATADTITADELAAALVAFRRNTGYAPTTIVAGDTMFDSLMKLTYNTSNAFGIGGQYTITTPQIPMAEIKLINVDLPKKNNKNIVLILNSGESLIKHTLSGLSIREYDKNIRNQTRLGTISEITGFSKPFKNSTGIIISK